MNETILLAAEDHVLWPKPVKSQSEDQAGSVLINQMQRHISTGPRVYRH